jgi:hypothetical protein
LHRLRAEFAFACRCSCCIVRDGWGSGARISTTCSPRGLPHCAVPCWQAGFADVAGALLADVSDEQARRAAQLEVRRRALQEERRELNNEIRNEARKRRRRLEKARGLSNQDLLEVAASRAAAAKAKAKANAKAKARAKSKARADDAADAAD